MSATRPAPSPPALDGYTPLELLGSGGYADVFLYEQTMPNRKVAVKVLHGGSLTSDEKLRQFTAEANHMAKVSTHPYIVSIFQAALSSDGRPFLVMEYYPGDNYLQRSRTEQFSVADVLRVGIQVASAVETAHRAGIQHRDIKPANVLTSAFRWPGLTDFGIASAGGTDGDDVEGMSIPWSPPEAFGSAPIDRTGDVYSLTATLYHLLAGRSPFELSGGDNGALALIERIERMPLPATGRRDVPASLERLLARGMAKQPGHRPESAADLARLLQAVQAELRLDQTPLELPDDGRPTRARGMADDDDATRIRDITEIVAQPPAPIIAGIPSTPAQVVSLPDRQRQGMLNEPAVSDTVHRPPTRPVEPTVEPHEGPPRKVLIGGVAAIAVIALAVLAVTQLGGKGSASPATTVAFGDESAEVFVEPVASVEDLSAETRDDGSVAFTWSAPGRQPGDTYALVQTSASGSDADLGDTSTTERVLSGLTDGVEVCLEVTANRVGSPVPASTKACITP